MKDGSDVITGCRAYGKTLSPVPFAADNVCLENGPGRPLGLHKDCDTGKSLPEATTNTWGDFESFSEFTPQSEHVYENGPLDESTFVSTIPNGEDFVGQTDGEAQWDAFNLGTESRPECERIFRLSFPTVRVEDTNEDVKSLQALLTSSNEENISKLIKTRLWLECDSSWQSGDSTLTKSGCEWKNSKGCRDLMMLLASNAENSSDYGGKSNDALADIEELGVNENTPPAGNNYLIQTKLDVAPGSKSGHIFSYQLVLKKSQSDVPLSFLNFSGKNSFFNANQLSLNF